jgi:hypothetical protein
MQKMSEIAMNASINWFFQLPGIQEKYEECASEWNLTEHRVAPNSKVAIQNAYYC